LRRFVKKREYSLILLPAFAFVFLFLASPALASFGNNNIKIVGQEAIWGGPNTWIASTYHFGSGPIFVKSGTVVALTDNTQDPHTLTLAVQSDLPNTAEDALNCGQPGYPQICVVAASVIPPPPSTPDPCYVAGTGSTAGGSPASPCALSTPFDVETATTGDQAVILPGQTLYLQITGSPGTIVHFMCIIHPWMQGEFVITK